MTTTTTQLNGQLAGLKGGRRRWQLDPDGALRMAREGSRKFLSRFKSEEERSAYFADLVRRRWSKQTTTTDSSGEAASATSSTGVGLPGCENGGAE